MGTIEDYIHRIGRTGRGPHGKGQALVFFEFWDQQPEIASQLIDVLGASDQPVPPELRRIAVEVATGKRGASARGNGWSGSNWASAGSWSTGKWSAGQEASGTQWGASGCNATDTKKKAGSGANGKASSEPSKDKACNGNNVVVPKKQPVPQAPEEVPDSWED